MALSLYLSIAIPLLLFLLLFLWFLLHWVKNKYVFPITAMLVTLLFCSVAFDGCIDAHRHLKHYRELQGTADAEIADIERCKWFTELENGRAAGYWWFDVQYEDDANIEYSYHYDPNFGMRCQMRHIGNGPPYSEQLYYPLNGWITLP